MKRGRKVQEWCMKRLHQLTGNNVVVTQGALGPQRCCRACKQAYMREYDKRRTDKSHGKRH